MSPCNRNMHVTVWMHTMTHYYIVYVMLFPHRTLRSWFALIWSRLSKTLPTLAGLQGSQSFRQWYYANWSHGHDLVREAKHLFPQWLAWWDTAKNFIESLFSSQRIFCEYLWIFGFGLAESCGSAFANLRNLKPISEDIRSIEGCAEKLWEVENVLRLQMIAESTWICRPCSRNGWALPV